MARHVIPFLLLLTLAWPAHAEAGDAYEGRAYAARTLGRTFGESSAASPAAFHDETRAWTAETGPYAVEGAHAEFDGNGAQAATRFTASLVRVRLNGLVLEARGVESRADASCFGGMGASRVDALRVGATAVRTDARRVELPGGLVVLLDESVTTRTAAVAQQATDAVRVLDATGATLATLGHAEARAYGCAYVEEGACPGFQPLFLATARAGDRQPGGASELLASTPEGAARGADHAWQNGVWTTTRLDYDVLHREATVTLHGTSSAASRVSGVPPNAVLVTLDAPRGAVDVEDISLAGLALGDTLTAVAGAQTWTLRSPVLGEGFALEANVRLTWSDATPPGLDDLRVTLTPGRCA